MVYNDFANEFRQKLNELNIVSFSYYDGCFADGISSIRSILMRLKHRDIYNECRGNKRLIINRLHGKV